jgi:hypothetical protein
MRFCGSRFRRSIVGLTQRDIAVVTEQLHREPRGVLGVAHRCPCGNPDVVRTSPRLPDGTPFPTLYYVTCPRLASAIGRLEANGVMRTLEERLADDPDVAEGYRSAHHQYLADRESDGNVPEIDGISAGGMPNRVKCLHVLVAHALSAGPGVNPLGDEAVALLGPWWAHGPCAGAGR